MTFTAIAPAYTFSGDALLLGTGGIVNAASNTQVFHRGVTLAGAQAWSLQGEGGGLAFENGLLISNHALTVSAAATTGAGNKLAGAISGTGSLTKTGAGTLSLTGSNSYTGGTTFAAGVLNVAAAQALGNSGTLSFNGGTLQYGTVNATDYSSRFSQAAGQNYRIDTNGQNVTFANSLGANGGATLAKFGGGTLTLTATSSPMQVVLREGVLNLGVDRAIHAASSFLLQGGILQYSQATGFDYSARFSTTANQKYNIDTNGRNVTFAGNLSSSGGVLTKLGDGTLWLDGSNTYSGGTVLAGGTVSLRRAGALSSSGLVTFSGGRLQYFLRNQVDYSARLSTAPGQMYNIDTNSQNVTFATGLSSPAGTMNKWGEGTLTLAGANTYTGDTLVHLGTLNITGSLNSGATASLAVDGNINIRPVLSFSGSSLETGAVVVGLDEGGRLQQTAGRVSTNAKALTLGKDASGNGTYTLSGNTSSLSTGPADIGLAGSGTFSQSGGSFTTNGKLFTLGSGSGSNGTFNLSGSTSVLSTGAATIGDAGTGTMNQSGGSFTTNGADLTLGLTATGRGTYNLNGGVLSVAAVRTGVPGGSTSFFNFNGGTLRSSANDASFMQGLRQVNVQAGGARIDTNGFNVTIGQALVHDTTAGAPATDGGLTKLGAGTLTLTGANTFNGPLNLVAGTLAVAGETNLGARSTVNLEGSGTLLFTGSATLARIYNLGGATLAAGSGQALTFGSGAIVGGGYLSGPGTGVLGSGSTLNGVTALPSSALTQASGAATVNNSTVRGAFTQTGGTLALNNGFITGAGRLSVGGTVNTTGTEIQGVSTINAGGTLANDGGSLYLTGGSRTTVASGGTLSTATGTTIELNGGLLVNNGSQRGTLNINYGSTVKGSGSFGTVNVADGGKFSPGNSPGAAQAENFIFGAGGRYDFELNSANPVWGSGSDLLTVAGILAIEAGTTPNGVFTIGVNSLSMAQQPAPLGDFDSSRPYQFLLVRAYTVSGFADGSFSVDASGFLNNLDGGSFDVSWSGNDLYLNFNPAAAVPEPATWLSLGLGLVLMGVYRQRRRSVA